MNRESITVRTKIKEKTVTCVLLRELRQNIIVYNILGINNFVPNVIHYTLPKALPPRDSFKDPFKDGRGWKLKRHLCPLTKDVRC